MFVFRSVELATGDGVDGARVCIDLVEGFTELADVRGKNWIVPRLDGQTYGNHRKNVRKLRAEGIIEGVGADAVERRESFRAAADTVMAVFDHSLAPGTLTLADGYLGLPVGSEATIQARATNVASGKLLNGQSSQRFTIELESLDPDWDVGSSGS